MRGLIPASEHAWRKPAGSASKESRILRTASKSRVGYMSVSPKLVLRSLTWQTLSCYATCYNFKQLKQLLTVAFHKEVTFRVEFKVQDKESFVYWETKTSYRTRLFYSRLYTRGKHCQGMKNIWYVYVDDEEWAWSAYGEQCVNNEE